MSSSRFLAAFADEVEKVAGIGGVIADALAPAAKFVAKHPMATIFGAVPVAAGAAKAYAGGLKGDDKEPVLQATAGHPSAYSDVNFHELIPHKLQPWEKFRLSRNYPSFRRGIGASK